MPPWRGRGPVPNLSAHPAGRRPPGWVRGRLQPLPAIVAGQTAQRRFCSGPGQDVGPCRGPHSLHRFVHFGPWRRRRTMRRQVGRSRGASDAAVAHSARHGVRRRRRRHGRLPGTASGPAGLKAALRHVCRSAGFKVGHVYLSCTGTGRILPSHIWYLQPPRAATSASSAPPPRCR
jgi:hypothetical protein